MFTVAVKDHVMLAHSFRGEVFGPAQRLHGGTYVITTEFSSPDVDENGIVVDIGLAHDVLAAAIEPLKYQNLDELEEFAGQNTTTEFLARWIHGRIADRMKSVFEGALRVVLAESHVAWAAYEAPVA